MCWTATFTIRLYVVKTKLPAKFTVYRTRLWWVILFVICYVFVCAFMEDFRKNNIMCDFKQNYTKLFCVTLFCCYTALRGHLFVIHNFHFPILMFKIETKIVFELYLKLILLIRLWWKWLGKYPFLCEYNVCVERVIKKCKVLASFGSNVWLGVQLGL